MYRNGPTKGLEGLEDFCLLKVMGWIWLKILSQIEILSGIVNAKFIKLEKIGCLTMNLNKMDR